MAIRLMGVTEVPGTNDGKGSRTVTYVQVDENGNRQTGTASVSGNKKNNEEQLKGLTGAESVSWAPN
ncbi:hypothetical protein CGI03_23925 [Vibrio parahaemolyticus]|uniref:hypothetical protein n=1 Tax=Vibrio TaxID=662 RepID=UPI0004118D9B|nr:MULTISPECIES: hypothetical protein [Vibrio]EGQ9939651.1 hypothetical protein [Vibrio vulnificus]EGR0054773.1 hypothetical protein [Vibrio vulnificus]EID4343160.1 hypothetical protein [Vibrio vulnificus]EID4377946.1 hypothetical protein [Vibrio vulnificus]EIF8963200.1 hypothetical protein [Vibrio parahaemolyticus]